MADQGTLNTATYIEVMIPKLIKTCPTYIAVKYEGQGGICGQTWQMVKILGILQYWMAEYLGQILHFMMNILDYIYLLVLSFSC